MLKERKQVEDNYNICRYTNFCCKLVFSLILLITLLQRSQIMSSYEETNFLQLFVDSRCKGGESKGGMIFAAFSEGTAAKLCYIWVSNSSSQDETPLFWQLSCGISDQALSCYLAFRLFWSHFQPPVLHNMVKIKVFYFFRLLLDMEKCRRMLQEMHYYGSCSGSFRNTKLKKPWQNQQKV